MDESVIFQAPAILRILCYLSGMAVFLSVVFWLSRKAFGHENMFTLHEIVGAWFLRSLVGCAFISLGLMVLIGGTGYYIFPELSLLSLTFALYLIWIKDRPLDWRRVMLTYLPRELIKVVNVALFCLIVWMISLGFGWMVFKGVQFFAAPIWLPIFIIGLVWNAPILLLFLKADRMNRLGRLKFYQLLWPVLLAYLVLMFPDIMELVANNPKIHALMDPSPPIVRV